MSRADPMSQAWHLDFHGMLSKCLPCPVAASPILPRRESLGLLCPLPGPEAWQGGGCFLKPTSAPTEVVECPG